MAVTIHKLTAGDGYLYLTRQVAAADATHRGRPSLADYYSSKGESPGCWMGRGLEALSEPIGQPAVDSALWRVEAGSEVTEAQMVNLFGRGYHPNASVIAEQFVQQGLAGTRRNTKRAADFGLAQATLGRPFHISDDTRSELEQRIAVAYRDYNIVRGEHWAARIDDEVRAQIRTQIARELFAAAYGREPSDDRELSGFIARESREPTTSVAGYDITFTPVKSVSVVWALAPLGIAQTIEDCHDRAVADALEYLQDHAAFTRTGAGGVAQVDTEGFIAAAFTHRDSRQGDPNLHTHVAVSNKVCAVRADGCRRWLALDGKPLYKANVAAAEVYNTRLEAHLIAALGLAFVERETAAGKRPIREVVGVSAALRELFSTRRAAIEQRYGQLAAQFQSTHGREPTSPESIALYQRANLATRQGKHEPRSLGEQRGEWRGQAVELLGSSAELAGMLGQVLSGRREAAREITPEWVAEQAAAVVETVSGSRSVWQRTHVYAEAQRRVREHNLHAETGLAERITGAALRVYSIDFAHDLDADMGEPALLRRRDGSSIYSSHGTQFFTNTAVLAAEKAILAAAHLTDGRRVSEAAIGLALLEAHANGRPLNAGQEAMVRTLAGSGARVGLALAPAGTGKTTAMAALARAWEEDGGHVIGLASSANAAHLLGNDMAGQGVHIAADTVDKLVWLTRNPQRRDDDACAWFDRIDRDTLIIVDEAGKSGTLALHAVIGHAQARGASVRLVGDNKQLSSISAGGVLTDIAHEVGAATLTEVMRFSSRAEAAATLALRDGDPAALGFYADEHRIHVGADTAAADMAFGRWVADGAQGWDSMLLAPTNETVTELNARAREHRLDGQLVTAEATLSDGLRASVGDIVSTRQNARSLRLRNGRDFVRNGYRWRVTKVNDNGALTVSRLGGGHTVTLPREYVDSHTTLGYAATIDAAQGDTIGSLARPGTCHVVGNDTLSRQQLYTSLSRGVSENHIYLSTAESDPHRVITPKALHPDTAIDVLTRALARDDAQVSATTATREAGDPFRRLAGAAQRYADSVGAAAEAAVDPAVMREVDLQADAVHAGLTAAAAWPVLRQHLAIVALGGDNPVERLREAVAKRELRTAGDVAAVLDWRLDYTCSHSSGIGPLRWLPNIPIALRGDPLWAEYLTVRRDLVAELADEIRGQVLEWSAHSAPAWARSVLSNRNLTAEIAVFRAAMGVEDSDSCITGPPQYPTRARSIQVMLQKAAEKIVGSTDWQIKRWREFVDELDPRIGRDAYWIPLAAHLSSVARTGVDVRQLLADAAGRAPLPDEMPAAALWWRLHGILTPAVVESASQRLRPAWLSDLSAVFGTTLAETIAADPAFPGLVAAVADADATRWTPVDLLLVAAEHLRDVETPVRPDEFARLLTYSIDLFTTEHPFDSAPPPTEAPMTAEEEEQLSLDGPPLTVEEEGQMLADAEFAAELGMGSVLSSPYQVEDLSVQRPAPLPLPAALADVNALRRAYQQAAEEVSALRVRIVQAMGPAVLAAGPQLLELRARAEADRPYMLAVTAVSAAWDDAEAQYQESLGLVESMRGQLRVLEADADADPLEVASARAGVRLAMMALPETPPAERLQTQLFDAIAARAAAAGGADRIVTAADVDAARLAAEAQDQEMLGVAAARRDEIRLDRDRAEAAAARAFAEARTRNADHIVECRDQIATELAVLNLAGGRTRAGGIPLSGGAVADLDPMAARAVASLARYDRTVTVVHAADDEQMLTAMSVLHAAAAAADRKVMWCAPTAELAEQARNADVADTVAAVDDASQRFRDGVWRLPPDSVLVLDHAADVAPNVIADLAGHADQNGARVILLDADEQRWPPPPSAALLRLLRQDLPWSATLSARAAVALRVPQPDLDAVLEQAAGFDQSLLPADVVEALAQRELMRGDRLRSHRTEQDDLSMRRGQSRDNGRER